MHVWILNPDAELELAHLARNKPGPYSASLQLRSAMRSRQAAFASLCAQEKSYFADQLPQAQPKAQQALPWCPTPSVIAAANSQGFVIPQSASIDALLRANNKLHLSDWDLPCLPGRMIIESIQQLEEGTRQRPYRLKRPFGFAGRAQRRLTSSWSADDRRWVQDSLAQGPLVVEPGIENPVQLSLHGLIAEKETFVGSPVQATVDRYGSVEHLRPHESAKETLGQHLLAAAARLRSAGYTGPFGIDFLQLNSGELCAIDLNARFSLGWSSGMGTLRAKAIELLFSTCTKRSPPVSDQP